MSKPTPKNSPAIRAGRAFVRADDRPKYEFGKGAGPREVPADAMKFDAAQFAWGDPHEMSAPISALARSSQPINHWYWGKVIHDMAGFTPDQPKIPLDYLHYSDELLGYLDQFEVKPDGLHCSGQITSLTEGDTADRCMKLSKKGVPYQASIYFRPEVVEEVSPGAKVQVNGYAVEGPAVIVRQWGLRGVALCPYGADHRTQSQFSDGDSLAVSVTVSQETQMSATPANTNSSVNLTQTETELGQTTPDQQKQSREAVLGELKKFTEKFGADNAAKWIGEGISYEAALERFSAQQAETIKQLTEKNAQLAEELKTTKSLFDRGETKPAEFNVDEKTESREGAKDTARFAHLGENRAKIAASLKFVAPTTPKK